MVADEKLILLNSVVFLSKSCEYMSTEEVFADPATPSKRQALLQSKVFFYSKKKSNNFFALKESRVGIRIWENLMVPEGFHSSGLHNFQSK